MAVIHGNAVGIFIDDTDTGAGDSKLVACATSATFSLNNATFEASCKSSSTAGALDDASVRHLGAGQQSWSMGVDGLVDLAASHADEEGYVDLVQLALDRTQITVVFSDGTAGNKQYSGSGYISSVEATASVDDFVTYSCSIEGTGTLAPSTVA